MDNVNNAPIIPMGTNNQGGVAYNPLTASINAIAGQAPTAPNQGQPNSVAQQVSQSSEGQAPEGITWQELAAKKGFQSPDDLAKAYANLESQNKKVEMSYAELSKARTDVASLPTPTTQDVRSAQTEEQAIAVVEKLVKRHTQPLEDRIALQDLFMTNPDAMQYAPKMAQAIKDNPGISWNAAYKIAKFDTLEATSKQQGKQEAYQSIQQKQVASVGTAPRPTVNEPKPIGDVAKMIGDRSIPWHEVQKVAQEMLTQRSSRF